MSLGSSDSVSYNHPIIRNVPFGYMMSRGYLFPGGPGGEGDPGDPGNPGTHPAGDDPNRPSDNPRGNPGRSGPSDKNRASPEARRRAGEAERQQHLAALAAFHSAAKPELLKMFSNPANNVSQMLMLIRQARQGTLGNPHLADPSLPGSAGSAAQAALEQLQSDFSGLRGARARLASAQQAFRSAGGPRSDIRSAREYLGAEQRLANVGERRQLTQAELAQKFPQLFARLTGRVSRFQT